MRILVWNSWITPAGGMERVALSIANGLAQRGHDVFLTGPFSDVPVLAQQIDSNVRLIDCRFERTIAGMLRSANHLRNLVRREKIDVISAHGSLFPLLALDTPVVWTEHGLRYGHEKILSGLRAIPWSLARKRLLDGKWRFVGCSRYVRQGLCKQFNLPEQEAFVIYNGVPRAGALQAIEPPRYTPWRLGYLGRLEPEKHPLDIFTIDSCLRARNLSCEWHVFGEGSLLPEMRRRAEAGDGRIHIHGLASSPVDAFAQMDVLTFLSHGEMEGLPTVLLEARLARRPAIAWNVTANPEAIGNRNWLVDVPFDLARYANKVAEVLRQAPVPPPVADHEISYNRMVAEYETVLTQAVPVSARQPRRRQTHA